MRVSTRLVFGAAAALTLVLSAALPATGSTTPRLGWGSGHGCWVAVNKPYLANGAPHADVFVWCQQNRTVIVNGSIREDDEGFDDDLSGLQSVSYTVPIGKTNTWNYVTTWNGYGCSNYDLAGKEEIFATAIVKVEYLKTSEARSDTLSTTC